MSFSLLQINAAREAVRQKEMQKQKQVLQKKVEIQKQKEDLMQKQVEQQKVNTGIQLLRRKQKNIATINLVTFRNFKICSCKK